MRFNNSNISNYKVCTPLEFNKKLTLLRVPTECGFQDFPYSGFQAGRLQHIKAVNLRLQFADEVD